jgi:hypothetical protein
METERAVIGHTKSGEREKIVIVINDWNTKKLSKGEEPSSIVALPRQMTVTLIKLRQNCPS